MASLTCSVSLIGGARPLQEGKQCCLGGLDIRVRHQSFLGEVDRGAGDVLGLRGRRESPSATCSRATRRHSLPRRGLAAISQARGAAMPTMARPPTSHGDTVRRRRSTSCECGPTCGFPGDLPGDQRPDLLVVANVAVPRCQTLVEMILSGSVGLQPPPAAPVASWIHPGLAHFRIHDARRLRWRKPRPR